MSICALHHSTQCQKTSNPNYPLCFDYISIVTILQCNLAKQANFQVFADMLYFKFSKMCNVLFKVAKHQKKWQISVDLCQFVTIVNQFFNFSCSQYQNVYVHLYISFYYLLSLIIFFLKTIIEIVNIIIV